MRVTLLSHYYEPEVGAPQRRWTAFVAALGAAGHDVTVVTSVPHYPIGRRLPGGPGRGTVRGRHGESVVRVGYVPYEGRRGRRMLDQLVVALLSVPPALRSRPDVVVATAPGLPTLLAGRLVAWCARRPLVVEMRDAWPDLLRPLGTVCLLRVPVTRLVTAVQRSADLVVCVSERFATRLAGRGARRTAHLPNGVDVSALAPLPPPPVRSGAGSAGPLRVLYAGTVGESQRVEQAVAAVAQLPPGTVRLTVVGAGAGLAAVRGAAARLPDPADLVLLPPTDPAGVQRLLGDHDTALVCLRDWEPFRWTVPSKLYELMAAGRHVSAALAGEAADIVSTTGAGLVVPPEDATALAAAWSALAADRSALAVGPTPRRWVQQHADDRDTGRRLVTLLEQVGTR